MEGGMLAVADDILRSGGGVEGVLCVDASGQCLVARGPLAKEEHAGVLHEILLKAKSATIEEARDPEVILLQFPPSHKILLRCCPQSKLTMAVYKRTDN